MSVMNHDDEPESGGMGRFLLIGAGGARAARPGLLRRDDDDDAGSEPEPAPAAQDEPARPAAARSPPSRRSRPPRRAGPGRSARSPPARPAAPLRPPVRRSSSRATCRARPCSSTASSSARRRFARPRSPGGSHQLNASVTGEEGLAQTIDVAESGDTTITLRFREVRLERVGAPSCTSTAWGRAKAGSSPRPTACATRRPTRRTRSRSRSAASSRSRSTT